jgi:hypothetical protein
VSNDLPAWVRELDMALPVYPCAWPIHEAPGELPPALLELATDERPRPAPAGGRPPDEREGPPPLAELRRVLTEVVAHRGRAIALAFPYAGRLGSPPERSSARRVGRSSPPPRRWPTRRRRCQGRAR